MKLIIKDYDHTVLSVEITEEEAAALMDEYGNYEINEAIAEADNNEKWG